MAVPTAPTPESLLPRLNRRIWQAEKWLSACLFLLMTLVMFALVIHKVFDRSESKLVGLITAILPIDRASIDGWPTTALQIGITFLVCYMAVRTMKPPELIGRLSRPVSIALAALLTYALVIVVVTVMAAFPNGLPWGPKIALACMLWVGFLGASTATYERRHLALERGEKIWPKKALPYMQAFAFLCAAGMSILLLVLAYLSIKGHYDAWKINPLTGLLSESLPIPKWMALLVFPYTFVMMGLRFLGQSAKAVTSKPPVQPEEKTS